MTEQDKVFPADIAERAVRVTWPDNDRGGAVPPPEGWQDRAWAQEPTLHEIDEGSVSGCSILRWREDPRSDAELIEASLALVTGKPQAARPAVPSNVSDVTVGQLYRDLAPDMKHRDRRLRVVEVGESQAQMIVEHDLGGREGKRTRASLARLRSAAFELVEDPADTDPLYMALLASISEVHRPGATVADYARAAYRVAAAPGGTAEQQ